MKKYRLADGLKAQALAVHVKEQRPGLSYAVSVRRDVLLRPGEVVETEYDMTPWVQAGLVVEVFDPAGKFKAALPVVSPQPTPVLEEKVEVPVAVLPGEVEATGEGEATGEKEEGGGTTDATPLAKAAARVARRRG
jgi:hypothetical protein